MVLKFSTIPLKLQVKIAEKTDFWDLIQLQRSSRHGNEVNKLISIMPILEVPSICISSSCARLSIVEPRSHSVILKNWDRIIKYENLPRFSVSQVDVDTFANRESFHPLVNEKHRFVKNKVKLTWSYRREDKANVISELGECFNIHQIESTVDYPQPNETEDTRAFLCSAVFQQVEKFSCPGFQVPGDILLSMKASTINVELRSITNLSVSSTLNLFFQQFFSNKRQIEQLFLNCFDPVSIEEMFSGFSYKLYWSHATHESTEFGYISLEGSFWNAVEEDRVYLVTDAGKKLLVYMLSEAITAEETIDEHAAVKKFILREP